MKTRKWVAYPATIIAFSAFTTSASLAQSGNSNAPDTIPVQPIGALTASPSVVQEGTHTTLSWSILYPSKVSDVATITPPGSLTLTAPMFVSVRPVGVGVTGSNSGEDADNLHVESRISVNGSSYDQLFYGTNEDVDPTYSLYIKKHHTGDELNFGGRYVENGGWTPLYTTKSSNMQVVSLVDGDTVPTTFDLKQSGNLQKYLKPYIDGTGKVKIGPLSVLVLMELAETSSSNPSYDYQDAVLLVSFSSKHSNNGHGNNLDGVDSSNPGGGSGGPNGEVDPSGGVDDEIRLMGLISHQQSTDRKSVV